MNAARRTAQIILWLFALIALFGGTLQFVLGQPTTTPRLDNVHRFLAGIYFGMGVICAWTAMTIRSQSTLVNLIGGGVFIAGCGRLLSMSRVGVPEPAWVWYAYLAPELVLSVALIVAMRLAGPPNK